MYSDLSVYCVLSCLQWVTYNFVMKKKIKFISLNNLYIFWGVFLINVKLNLKTFWNVEKFK